MDLGQQPLVNLDSAPEKLKNGGEGASDSRETPEQKKKLRTVGFYELEDLQTPKSKEAIEDGKSVKDNEDGDGAQPLKGYLEGTPPQKDYLDGVQPQKGDLDGAQPHEGDEKPPSYFDQDFPRSPQTCHRLSNLTCLCKECVENHINLCEEAQGPPGTEEHKDAIFLPCEDSNSIGSDRRSRSESQSSDRSRRTNSSEEDWGGQRYEDGQVTLPYPEKNPPPECITRLSNAGLYQPNDGATVKNDREEDNEPEHRISPAFFVKHPEEPDSKQKRVQLEMMDIERGEPECEPLLRTMRRPAEEDEPPHPMLCHCSRGCLKIVGSFVAAMVVFPAFLYAAYAWLPFDTPVMPDIPTRLVYTMRCAAFATFPLVLGVIIHGVSRLCTASYDPFKPREREVTIHRRFVKQGTFLFVLYFFNLSVLATYLRQDYLKIVPLLTGLFALAQLTYWLSFAVTRSLRGFGYGLTFLPLLFMMISNLYFMFVVEPDKMIFIGSKNAPPT